jgi:SAM-dependent methyltransferase
MDDLLDTYEKKTCRICASDDLAVYLDLGTMPLVNRYLQSADETHSEPRFPLQIAFCRKCGLSQLTWVVDPRILYADYAYHSSISQTFRDHCQEMAVSLRHAFGLDRNSRILEIASNDGCLQRAFRSQNLNVVGVEPAQNLAEAARAEGFSVITAFWTESAAQQARAESGPFDVVIATNVVAHVDDLLGFLTNVRAVLSETGIFVFEVPYLKTFLTKTEFDTTYHEHLSYFLLTPLQHAARKAGLRIFDVQEMEIHGGSIRVFATADPARQADNNVERMAAMERDCGFLEFDLYRRFSQHVETVRDELSLFLQALHARGKKIAAYCASAKGNVLLNYCRLDSDIISYVVDDTPAKQGKYCPGNGLPIVSRDRLKQDPPSYLLLLAWNFSDELMANLPDFQNQGGRFVLPIPALRIL